MGEEGWGWEELRGGRASAKGKASMQGWRTLAASWGAPQPTRINKRGYLNKVTSQVPKLPCRPVLLR